MKIAIRTDASIHIGTGHVMRCLTLAEELRGRGADILFVSRRHQGNLCGLISEKGFHVECLPASGAAVGEPTRLSTQLDRSADESLPAHAGWLGGDWRQDAGRTAEAIENVGGVDWLVVDHYALDARWESELRAVTRRIMVIDDLADRSHDCDLLLDQNLLPSQHERYRDWVPQSCDLCFGPQYLLLRDEFAHLANTVSARSGPVRRSLICFGGSDSCNHTAQAIGAMASAVPDLARVDVVIGSQHPAREDILKACSAIGFTCHVQSQEMAHLMELADIAVASGGMISYELAVMGVPMVLVPVSPIQEVVANEMARRGAATVVAPHRNSLIFDLCETLQDIARDHDRRQKMSQASKTITDGHGAHRIAEMLFNGRHDFGHTAARGR